MSEVALLIIGAVLGAIFSKGTEWSLDWFRKQKNPESPRVITSVDVLSWGWNGEKLLKKLIALDRKILGDELTSDSREGTVDQWAPLFMRDVDGWSAIAIDRQIIGYYSFFALIEDSYERAKRGHLLDSEVTIDNTVPFDVPGIYKGYFVLIGADPKFSGAGRKLLDSFFDNLQALAERGVLFEEMLANAFTADGKRTCEGFGMEKLCDHSDFGVVYSLRLKPWPSRLDFKRWQEIKQLYEERLK
ncbi:MAG: hypothetical protein KDJ54_09510 [Candidatus Competibacteraceae bacterium]|nr:hypothetical protein [Candidatus Competibacteraceae bacterium]